jgi:hypothetical protein
VLSKFSKHIIGDEGQMYFAAPSYKAVQRPQTRLGERHMSPRSHVVAAFKSSFILGHKHMDLYFEQGRNPLGLNIK